MSDTRPVVTPGSDENKSRKINGGSYCSALWCNNSQKRCPGLSFFSFPRDERRCKIWIAYSLRKDLVSKNNRIVSRSYKLCGEHFKRSHFMCDNRKRLTHDAIPTLPPAKCSKVLSKYISLNTESESIFQDPNENSQQNIERTEVNTGTEMGNNTGMHSLLITKNQNCLTSGGAIGNTGMRSLLVNKNQNYITTGTARGGNSILCSELLNVNNVQLSPSSGCPVCGCYITAHMRSNMENKKNVEKRQSEIEVLNQCLKEKTEELERVKRECVQKMANLTKMKAEVHNYKKALRNKTRCVTNLKCRFRKFRQEHRELNNTDRILEAAKNYLSGYAFSFFAMQFKLETKKWTPWPDDMKYFCTSLYSISPPAYKFLSYVFIMPVKRSLQHWRKALSKEKINAFREHLQDSEGAPHIGSESVECEIETDFCEEPVCDEADENVEPISSAPSDRQHHKEQNEDQTDRQHHIDESARSAHVTSPQVSDTAVNDVDVLHSSNTSEKPCNSDKCTLASSSEIQFNNMSLHKIDSNCNANPQNSQQLRTLELRPLTIAPTQQPLVTIVPVTSTMTVASGMVSNNGVKVLRYILPKPPQQR